VGDHGGGSQKSAASIVAHAIMDEGSNRWLSRMNRDMEPARAAEACGAIHTGLCREYRTESGRVRTGAANWASSPENPLPATDSLMELVVARDNVVVTRTLPLSQLGLFSLLHHWTKQNESTMGTAVVRNRMPGGVRGG